ncbi:N-acyl homoserine lactonase family protein [Nocardia acidivorans]|uniref:N-acyl homoserine lactonase family protein n=1 Tax=Nocardia acidivorans TaxID=404580 RepID=UPI00082E678D|nr:N-acyl homoserine lactonase family protein [Nocardia acidivorans]
MRLYLFRFGVIPGINAPVPGYLVQTEDGVNILIDTGAEPGGMVQVDPQDDPVARLAAVGVRPADVDFVVCSHLDPDHAGNHDRFPGAEFVVQRTHLAAARAGDVPRLLAAKEHWGAPGLRYREVDGDTELLPGIELIASGGHVPGHQSVLVRLPGTGPVLLAVDAIPNGMALDAAARPIFPFDTDEEQVRVSTAKLIDLAEREGALIVRGHDAEQWPTLRHAPEFYG